MTRIEPPTIAWSEVGRSWVVTWPNGAPVGDSPSLLEAEAMAIAAVEQEEARQ